MSRRSFVLNTVLVLLLLLFFETLQEPTRTVASPLTTVHVSPSMINATIGQIFTVSINVSETTNLWAWQAGITFNPNVLKALSFEEGPFLKQGGTTLWQQGTIDNTNGTIGFYGNALVRFSTPINGSGNLAVVKFQAKGEGQSRIHLADVILVNFKFKQITTSISDGTVAVYKPVGVGGIQILVDKIGLLVPYIVLAAAVSAILFGLVYARKRLFKKDVVQTP